MAITHQDAEAALILRHIELDSFSPNRAEARVIETGVNVWALVAYRDANNANLAEVADAYDLSFEAAEAAFAFYRRNKCAINGRIALNERDHELL